MSYTFKITAILVSMIFVIHSTVIESISFRPVTGGSILSNDEHYQEEKSEGQVPGDYFEYLSEEDANTSMVAISSESADYQKDYYFSSSNSTSANSSQSTEESVLPEEVSSLAFRGQCVAPCYGNDYKAGQRTLLNAVWCVAGFIVVVIFFYALKRILCPTTSHRNSTRPQSIESRSESSGSCTEVSFKMSQHPNAIHADTY